MTFKNIKQGWYKLLNPGKFIPPADSHMKSFNENAMSVNYKSSLELKSIQYCDSNEFVKHWSLEPYPIYYIKPTDNKRHRYFVDLYIEFANNKKVIVEIKSNSETKPPCAPKKPTLKSKIRHAKALQTYAINQAKWDAAKIFAKQHNMLFTIITENELS